jgi:putative alpha-1,2-mannosidase
MYDELGQAWKTQKLINEVMNTLYLNFPEGYCGNEDTGQMAAWYLWNALGMYPVTHGDGRYYIGTPLFKKIKFKHANGTLTVISDKQSPNHFYIDEIKVNGKEHRQFWFDHNSIFKGDVTISFKMSDRPNKNWFIQ